MHPCSCWTAAEPQLARASSLCHMTKTWSLFSCVKFLVRCRSNRLRKSLSARSLFYYVYLLTFSRSLSLSDVFAGVSISFVGRPFIVISSSSVFFIFCLFVSSPSSSCFDRTDRAGYHDFYRLLSILAVFLCQVLKGFNLSRFLSVPFSSVQDDIHALGKRFIIILSTPSLWSFPTVAFQTVLSTPSLWSFPTVAFQTVLSTPSLSFPTVAFQTVLSTPSLWSFRTVAFQTVLSTLSLSFPPLPFKRLSPPRL